ncbi:hypothetical protein [Paenibacillus hubeiensis]|uniref:hypothetical protein n=1 Tax=Paenibacillus hubeiensis TaxID=3077330 RepID=UPI0031BAA79D
MHENMKKLDIPSIVDGFLLYLFHALESGAIPSDKILTLGNRQREFRGFSGDFDPENYVKVMHLDDRIFNGYDHRVTITVAADLMYREKYTRENVYVESKKMLLDAIYAALELGLPNFHLTFEPDNSWLGFEAAAKRRKRKEMKEQTDVLAYHEYARKHLSSPHFNYVLSRYKYRNTEGSVLG